MRWLVRVFPLAACLAFFTPGHADEAKKNPVTGPVSFTKQIRPILQANCLGCHQPAKARGDYVMTDVREAPRRRRIGRSRRRRQASGTIEAHRRRDAGRRQSEDAARGQEAARRNRMSRSCAVGWPRARSTTRRPNARARFDADHPPIYTRPPVIPALDFSPDGKLIAVAGFNEVLLCCE